MDFKEKSDEQLLYDLKKLVVRDKEIQLELLRYLDEVESRQLHLSRAYPSLFAFCIGFLRFSEGEAILRIRAMRLIRSHPELGKKISDGTLSISVVAKAQSAFRRERSRRSAEVPAAIKIRLLSSIEGKSLREAEREIAATIPELPPAEKIRPLNQDYTRIEFTAGKRLFEKLEKLKQLLAHQNFSGRYDLLIEHLADRVLEKLLPKNNALLPDAPQATKRGRYILKQTRNRIFEKFETGCSYVDLVS